MSELPTYFNDFLSDIRPTLSQRQDCQTGHITLRERLMSFEELKPYIITSFIQGSIRRSTAIKPKGDDKLDVDIVVVTNLDKNKYTPLQAFNLFKPFLEKYYNGKYKAQSRSWGVELSYVDLDLVITAAPSEALNKAITGSNFIKTASVEDFLVDSKVGFDALTKDIEKWKNEPLLIPDRDLHKWQETHPLKQIEWTAQKNFNTNGNYVNVVKAIKWWRKTKFSEQKYPKSYPLEHIIGDCCPDGIKSVAEGIVSVFQNIISIFLQSILLKQVPELKDRGAKHNVLARLDFEDFEKFYKQIEGICETAKMALSEPDAKKNASLWYEIFGEPYPKPDNDKSYTPRSKSTLADKGSFA